MFPLLQTHITASEKTRPMTQGWVVKIKVFHSVTTWKAAAPEQPPMITASAVGINLDLCELVYATIDHIVTK